MLNIKGNLVFNNEEDGGVPTVDDLTGIEEVDMSFFLDNDFNDEGELKSKEGDDKSVEENSEDGEEKEEKEEKNSEKDTQEEEAEEEGGDDDGEEEEESEEEEEEEGDNEEEDKGDNEEEDKVEKKNDSSALRKFYASKERQLRDKEKAVKELEQRLKEKEKDFEDRENDETSVEAKKLREALKTKNISVVWEAFGINELDVLEHYGITDPAKAKETAEMAKVRKEKEAVALEKKELEMKRQQAAQQQAYQKAKREIEEVTAFNLPELDNLKHFNVTEVADEVETGVIKWINANPDITKQLTYSQMSEKVLEHLDKVWGKRADKIRPAKTTKSNKVDKKPEKEDSNPSKKKKAGKTKAPSKKKPTLSDQTAKKGSSKIPSEWSPDVGEDFEEAVFKDLFG